MEYLIRTEFFIHFGGALVLAILLSYFLKVFKLPLQLRLPIAFFAVLALGYGYELLQGKAADTGTDILADLAGAAIGILAWALIEKKFNILLIIAFMILLSCDEAPAQVTVYDIEWELIKDGVTYEYIVFMAISPDSSNIPFWDSLYNYPEESWSQFLLGYYNHDSLYAVDPDRAAIEIVPPVDHLGDQAGYMAVAFFARSTNGFYNDRAVAGPFYVPPGIRPQNFNQAGIIITSRKKWR